MSSLNELTGLVAEAQKHTIATVREATALAGRAFEGNLNLAEQVLNYQREAFLRYAGAADTKRK
jgi:hypothetical protein